MRGYFFGKGVKTLCVNEKIQFIRKYLHAHRLKLLLSAVKLAKSSYYEYQNRKPSKQKEERMRRRKLITEIFHQYDSIYGARKIKIILQNQGISASIRTISNDLKALDLRSCYVKKYRPKSKSSADGIFINYLKHATTTKPLEHVVTDITYIHTIDDGWVYQLTFMDAYTRKVLLFDVAKRMDSSFVNALLEKLLRRFPSVCLIHSDRGSQFTAFSYQFLLQKYDVLASYSAKGYPYDNAFIESYHASLKIEKIYRINLENLKDAYRAVFEYNFGFYNTRRIHQSLGYLTPNQFEKTALAA